jgi:hypothetical protein
MYFWENVESAFGFCCAYAFNLVQSFPSKVSSLFKLSTMSSTKSCGPSSAAVPAICTGVLAHIRILHSFSTACLSSSSCFAFSFEVQVAQAPSSHLIDFGEPVQSDNWHVFG